jgi:Holliday junction resolvase
MKYAKEGYPALRVPGSGNSKNFLGDIFAIVDNSIELCLVRRTENRYHPIVKFHKEEIESVVKQADKIAKLLDVPVRVKLIAHFPLRRKWVLKSVDHVKDDTILSVRELD